MPTGLTSKIYDGSDLSMRSFALACAKHIGAGYQLSNYGETDLPLDHPPVLKPSTFHQECLKRETARLAELEYMRTHPEKAKEEYEKECRKRKEDKAELISQMTAAKKRYKEMREKVERWDVPGDFQPLKSLMLEQLEISIDGDCNFDTSWYDTPLEPMDEWLENNIEFVKESIKRHLESIENAEKSVAKVNSYMAHLYALLDEAEPLK